MDSKSVRTIAIFGVLAAFALTILMMFSLNQVADTQTPQFAADISKDLARGLAAEPPVNVRLTMARDGKGVYAARTYRLVIRPNAAVGADARAVSRLMYRASELCAAQLGELKCDVTITCVAELPDGSKKEQTFVKDRTNDPRGLALIHAVAAAPQPAPVEPAVPEPSQR